MVIYKDRKREKKVKRGINERKRESQNMKTGQHFRSNPIQPVCSLEETLKPRRAP